MVLNNKKEKRKKEKKRKEMVDTEGIEPTTPGS
jgi:hypothetical protein